MLAVFRKDLRIFLRDRSAFVFSLLMPILVSPVMPGLNTCLVNQSGRW